MKLNRPLVAAAVALAAIGATTAAQAHGVVSLNIGVPLVGPAYYAAPAPVYVAPPPVYYSAPAPVYYSAPVAYAAPVMGPAVGVSWIWEPHYHRYYRWHQGHRVWR